MSQDATGRPIRIAIDVPDVALAERLTAILATAAGVQKVGAGEDADVVLVQHTDRPAAASVEPQLTPRELEVLALLAEGASNKTIAARLNISVHTAKFHVGSVMDKLDAVGRTDAVAQAARLRVINL